MAEYKDFLVKQLDIYQKKEVEAEENYQETGDKRYDRAHRNNEQFANAFISALQVENGKDITGDRYKTRVLAIYDQCNRLAEFEQPAKALTKILEVLKKEAGA